MKAVSAVRMPPPALRTNGKMNQVAALDGSLYVVGGFANGKWLSAVERYDPQRDVWEDLNELSCPISAPGLAVA